ncbi:MAG: Rossmann-fold NAD(P)-binding domain-containing protein [Planctomycetota bacterium]|jgi:hypothetical protein
MDRSTVASLECTTGEAGDLREILAEMLSGGSSAGARTRHLVLSLEEAGGHEGVELFAGAERLEDLVDALADCDHLILGLGAAHGAPDGMFAGLRDECYRQARWVSLADVAGQQGVEIQVRESQNLDDFRFPVPRRDLTGEHRGLVVVTAPAAVPDHDDPFLEKSFFVAEELLCILGFRPSGRILATGLYGPPIEENPYLQEQAFELGRRLTRGVTVAGK